MSGYRNGRLAPGLAALDAAHSEALALAVHQARGVSPAAGEAVRQRVASAIRLELDAIRRELETRTTSTSTSASTSR